MILGNKCDMDDKRAVSKDRGEAVSIIYLKSVWNEISLFLNII